MTSKFHAAEGFVRNSGGSLSRRTVCFERRDGKLFAADDFEPLEIAREVELRGWGRDDGPAIDFGQIIVTDAIWRVILADNDFWSA